jgi:hypothetical protein
MNKFLLAIVGIVSFGGAEVFAMQVDVDWTTSDQSVEIPNGTSTNFNAAGSIGIGGTYDAIIAIDSSSSMRDPAGATASNGGTTIGDWVYSAAESIIQSLDHRIRVGVVEFNRSATLHSSIDQLGAISGGITHRQSLIDSFDNIDIGGSTNLVRAISTSANSLLAAQQNPSIEQNIILVSDGIPTYADGNGRRQTRQHVRDAVSSVFDMGIESVHTIGFPNSNSEFLEELSVLGNGLFADGSNLGNLNNAFAEIFNSIESVERLDVILPDGTELSDLDFDLDGSFAISGDIYRGENIFTARVTSTTGVVTESRLTVTGFSAVPEPSSALGIFSLGLGFATVRRRRERLQIAG